MCRFAPDRTAHVDESLCQSQTLPGILFGPQGRTVSLSLLRELDPPGILDPLLCVPAVM